MSTLLMRKAWNIENYAPNELSTSEDIMQACRRLTDQTLGQPLTASWVGWYDRTDEWCEHMPVVLEIGDIRHEILWQKDDCFAFSQDTIDVEKSCDLYRAEELPVHWKRDALPELRRVLGKSVTGLHLVEFGGNILSDGSRYWMPFGILFVFGDLVLEVYNGWDCNNVSGERHEGDDYRCQSMPSGTKRV